MKVGGAAGPSQVQHNGVRQGCPLSPTLFGIFFDGLHGHLDCSLPHAGLQLGSGRWVSALVYADHVVLLSWTAAGLQDLLASMHAFCLSLGLTIALQRQRVLSSMAAALTRGMLGSMFSLGLQPSSTWALSFMSLAA